MTQERLSISGVEAIGGKPSCDNVVVMEDEIINHIRQDGSAGVKVSLDGSNDDITGKTCPGIIGWNEEHIYDMLTGKVTAKRSTNDKWIEFKNRLK